MKKNGIAAILVVLGVLVAFNAAHAGMLLLVTSPNGTFAIGHELVTPTPSISPEGGTFTSPQLITISDGLPGSTIYYTTDGTSPTSLSSIYAGPFTASTTDTIRAQAIATGYGIMPSRLPHSYLVTGTRRHLSYRRTAASSRQFRM